MKVLAASAKFVTRIPMGIDQYLGQQTYVAGVVADAERVYVLLVTDAYFGGGPLYASLHVFRTDTGALLHAEAKVGKDLWKKNHPPTAGPGPLQLRKNGVELDGELYEFKGTQLIKPMGKDKK
jgi:hypothetical protein